MEACIIDSETTGLTEPELIEFAWLPIAVDGAMLDTGFAKRYRPSKPIQCGAMATHSIMDEDLIGCDPSSSFVMPEGIAYIIAFNCDFDWQVIGKPDVKRIDVLAMCRSLWPEADSHTLAAMLYLLERNSARNLLRDAHSALTDCFNCRRVLLHVLQRVHVTSFEELWQASERMRIPTTMPFGKHRGVAIKDLPLDYRQWMLKQPDMDAYVLTAVRNSMPKARAA